MGSPKEFYEWLVHGLGYVQLDLSTSVSAACGTTEVQDLLRKILAITGFAGDPNEWSTIAEFVEVQSRVEAAIFNLQQTPAFTDGLCDANGKIQLPVGRRYVNWYAAFVYHINVDIIRNIQNSIIPVDAKQIYLLDMLFCPGFGQGVNGGWTIWSYAQTFFWLSAIMCRFAELVQRDNPGKALAYHMECTETFTFSDFIQKQGMLATDSVSYMYLASLMMTEPLRFLRYKGNQSPACLMVLQDANETKYFRRSKVPLRTPTMDTDLYRAYQQRVFPAGAQTSYTVPWAGLLKASASYLEKELRPGANAPGDTSLLVPSSDLLNWYLPSAGAIQYGGSSSCKEMHADAIHDAASIGGA